MDYVENLFTTDRFPQLSRLFVAARPVGGTLSSEVLNLVALRDRGDITPEQFDTLVSRIGI